MESDQADHFLWGCGCSEHCGRTAILHPENDGAFAPGCAHDCFDLCPSRLQWGKGIDWNRIGRTGPQTVEQDQTAV